MENLPKILVMILNYNRAEDTIECVESVLRQSYAHFQILLLDNASEDFDTLNKRYAPNPLIRIFRNEVNLGFAKAHNLVYRKISNELDENTCLALINNDAVAQSDWLEKMVQVYMHANADLISCKILNYYQPKRLDNVGHRMLTSGEIVPIGFNEYANNYMQSNVNVGPCAAACLYSHDCLKRIGFFDPFFDTGYEDAELGLRALVAGYVSVFAPDAIVKHKISQSVSKIDNLEYRTTQQVNIYYSYFKCMPALTILFNMPAILIKYFLVILVELLSLRWHYFRIHFKTIVRTMKLIPVIREKRKQLFRTIKPISAWKVYRRQSSFLLFDIRRMFAFLWLGQKTVFDKSKANSQ